MFGLKKRRRRRSELRLGTQKINYQTEASRPALVFAPALKFWKARGTKVVGLSALVMLVWTFYSLFSTPFFFVYEATIHGNATLSTREIYAVSGVDSQSVFWLDPVKVTDRILTLPNIKSASVSVTLPARVTIKVVERRPELLWQSGETTWWIDQEGTVVPPKGNINGMLRIIDDDRQALEAGYQIDPTLVEGAQMLRILAPDVSVIRYSRSQGLTVATPEGWPIYLGDGSEIKAKLVVLTRVLADLKERNIIPAYINLGNPLRPVFKPKNLIRIGEPINSTPGQPPPVPPETP